MRVDVIDEPESAVQKERFLDACKYMEELDFEAVAAAEAEGDVLCLRLRRAGGLSTSLVAVPLKNARAVLADHIETALGRMPNLPQQWPAGFVEMGEKPLTPKVGVGVVVTREDESARKEILLGIRKGSHGAGEWSVPGGHLELGETPRACARRELMEETGINGSGFSRLGWSNDVMPDDGLHYVTLFLRCRVPSGTEAQLKEPDRTEEWRWFELSSPPPNVFAPTAKLLGAVR